MQDFSTVSDSLVESLHLDRKPVAVCLTDTVPEGLSGAPARVPGGCVFWEQAADGPFATSTSDHELCAVGVHTHQMAEPGKSYATELGEVLKVMTEMEYVREEDVAAIPVLQKSPRHVIYAPLDAAPVPPDVVLLFADSAQGLIITEAVQQVDPDPPPAMGRPACAVIPQAMNTGRPALSLGCCGARAYMDSMSDGVALWALPGARVAEYAERIAKLASANATLGRFHALRRRDVEAGGAPTYRESLARLES